MSEKEFYTVAEIMERLSVSKSWVQHRIKKEIKDGAEIEKKNNAWQISAAIFEKLKGEAAADQAKETDTEGEKTAKRMQSNAVERIPNAIDYIRMQSNAVEEARKAAEIVEKAQKEEIESLKIQLQAKDEQIKILTDLLKKAQELQENQQKLQLMAERQLEEARKPKFLLPFFRKKD